jgi:hypothetical protein
VIEVDEHRPIGDHALLPDPDVLVGRDRALLPEDGLRPDDDLALVAADLRAVAQPDEPPEPDRPLASYLYLKALAEEEGPIGPPAPSGGRQVSPPRIPTREPRVLRREHPVAREEPEQSQHARGL